MEEDDIENRELFLTQSEECTDADATMMDTSSNIACKSALLQHSPDLWQILHGAHPEDGPDLELRARGNKLSHVKTKVLNFGAHDWDDLIQRGYSWIEFHSFVKEWGCLCVGPIWISRHDLNASHMRRFMEFGKLHFTINQKTTKGYNDDLDDAKSLLRPLLALFALHPEKKSCTIEIEPDCCLSLILDQNEMILDYLCITGCYHQHIDAARLHMIAARTRELALRSCIILSAKSTLHPSPSDHYRNNQMQSLTLSEAKIDTDVLVSLIQTCTSLNTLLIWNSWVGYGTSYRDSHHLIMTLATACLGCEKLDEFTLRGLSAEEDVWLNGLAMLMRIPNLSSLEYYVFCREQIGQERMNHAFKTNRVVAIAQALQCNNSLTKLCVERDEIDGNAFHSKIRPLLKRNRLQKNISTFCSEMVDNPSGMKMLGRVLHLRLLRQNPSLLFETIRKTNQQLAHIWEDGRRQRILMAIKSVQQAEVNLLMEKRNLAELYEYEEMRNKDNE